MSRVPTHEIPYVEVAQDETVALRRAILDHMNALRANVIFTPQSERFTREKVVTLGLEQLRKLYSELGITPVAAIRAILQETDELIQDGSYSPKQKKGIR